MQEFYKEFDMASGGPLYDPFYRRHTELSCQDDCVLWGQRVVVPTSLQAQLLRELHEGHIGIARMKALAFGGPDWIKKLKP